MVPLLSIHVDQPFLPSLTHLTPGCCRDAFPSSLRLRSASLRSRSACFRASRSEEFGVSGLLSWERPGAVDAHKRPASVTTRIRRFICFPFQDMLSLAADSIMLTR